MEYQLREAIKNDHYDEVKSLLDSRNELLEIPLQYEFVEDKTAITLNVSPLILATAFGKSSIVELLLNNGAKADAEVPSLGGTALHLAVRYGPRDVVDLLIPKVDINRKDRNGPTPRFCLST
ncbi:ankyrin repeat-containing domain protein [Daldinia sp. FL1419]|nr:ankyrin repeat-containing domain protein [Daldinia sp. FL1419]